jgi:cohesin complex subunit SCC1
MFFPQIILAKRGYLGRVWLAAHWEKKVNKAQYMDTDVSKTIKLILEQPPLALRLSGHLLLGVIKIYSKKVQFLLADCNEALVKIRMVQIFLNLTFRPIGREEKHKMI